MSSAPLTPAEREQLLEAAKQAVLRAYAPYSNFHVGAAVLTDQGQIFTGCNVENASYGLTICAERSAIFTAVHKTHGPLVLRAVAVANRAQVACSPCGACRQVIAEFGRDVVIIFQGKNGFQESTIADLLPETFRLS
ncbi:MAG TPA: cytidine deaminase [Candidatus Sulfotelmatobacter sp.]|nr:cytidine deaminase [Candidatus Sulfotelmatobacter sp.]